MLFLSLILASTHATTSAPASLQAFEPLIGHCWSGLAPDHQSIDTHCFTSVFDGQHLRDAHHVVQNGKTVYAGETLYSIEDGRITFTYWNSIGGIGRGNVEVSGAKLIFSGQISVTPTSPKQPMDVVWSKQASGYDVLSDGSAPIEFRLSEQH